MDLFTEELSPNLNPYPSWETNFLSRKRSESSIVSTFRIKADECDRLWVVDTGYTDILNDKQVYPYSLVIFDLINDKLMRRYYFPEDQIENLKSALTNVAVDVSESDCESAHTYITDTGAYGLLVYSFKDNKSWRIKHNFFSFDPLLGTFSLEGKIFQWKGGIFGLALGQRNPDSSRDVYFHSIISTKEFVVSSAVLQNESSSSSPDSSIEYKLIGDRGDFSFSGPEVFDPKSKTIFYTLIAQNAIGCWNAEKGISKETAVIIDYDPVSLVFPNDIRMDEERNLWVVTDRLFHFIQGFMDPNDVNYRILTVKIDDLIEGSVCDKPNKSKQH